MKETTIKVEGMTCGGCVNSVTKAIQRVEGVENAQVSLENKEAKVRFDESKTNLQAIAESVEKAGYHAAV